MWGHGWYISKSIVNFAAESSAHAAAKHGFEPWPWVVDYHNGGADYLDRVHVACGSDGADEHRKKKPYAALGPNPSILCNAVAKTCGGASRQREPTSKTHIAFNKIAELFLQIVPTALFFTVRNMGTVQVDAPRVLRTPSYRMLALLQLSMCKYVQVMDAWFSGVF